MRTGGFVVGEHTRGRITDKSTIQLAQALQGSDGRPDGVMVASIDLNYLAVQQARVGLPHDATLTVTDKAGVILIRVPDHAEWVGKPVRLVVGALGEPRPGRGHARTARPDAHHRRRGRYSGRPRQLHGRCRPVPEVAFTDIDAATWRGLVLISLGAALALAAALLAGRAFIRRPVRRLLRAASAWRTCDFGARTGLSGPTEFGLLGEASDGMAASLQKHEGELRAELSRSRLLQERQTMMLHELNHRVRNTLTTVQSLARQARRGDATGEELEGRILALSKTHDLLSRDDWSGASLRTVLENELSPFREGQANRFRLDGPDLDLAPRYVLALGMTVHELTTNAAKYGALAVEGGQVNIAWRIARPMTACAGSRWSGTSKAAHLRRSRVGAATAPA